MKSTHKIWIMLLLSVLFLLAGIAASLKIYQHVATSYSEQRHTLRVIDSFEDFLSALKDAETGERGFVITGNEAFLRPYLAERDNMQVRLQYLEQILQTDAGKASIQELRPLLTTKMAHMAQVIALKRTQNDAQAVKLVNQGEGKQLMDDIRSRVQTLIQTERVTLAQHEVDYQATLFRLFNVMLGACLLFFIAALSFTYHLHRQGLQRQDALLLQKTRQSLEQQQQLNAQLQTSNLALQRSEELLSITLNSIDDGVITTNALAQVTGINPMAIKLTGVSLEQALGRRIDDVLQIVNKSTRERVPNPVMAALQNGSTENLLSQTVLLARDGSEHDIADSCAPILTRDGQVIGAVLVFRNVTQAFAAQESARTNAVLMQTILNSVADGVLTLHGNDFVVETVNPAMTKMFGYAEDEIVGQDIRRLIPTLSPLAHAAAATSVSEVQGHRKDGSQFSLEITLNEMWLGNERHYTGVLRDSTERKQAEEAVLKGSALQKAIFESANFSSIATDAQGVIQIFNVGAERMLGYTALEVINKITPADISDAAELIARAKSLSLEMKTPIKPGLEALVFKASRDIEDIYELTYIRKDHSRFPALFSVTALRDAQEIIIGYLLIGTDNTARRQVEEERKKLDQRLRDQQFYTRSLIEANIDAIITTDPSGIITDVNKQMELLTSCTRDELIGAPFKKYFTDPEHAKAAIDLVLNEKKVINYVLTARTLEGLETVVSFNATTFYDRNRNLQGVFAAARDVTERKRLDGALVDKNLELEAARTLADKANSAKSDFLSSMSHELRSPLNAILGFAQLMASETPAPTDQQQRRISQIIRAGWHLLNLINEILELTKIESRQFTYSMEPVHLGKMVGECLGMVEMQAQQLGIAIQLPSIDKALFVHADSTRLKQVLINLLTNAIKYNRPQGSVDVLCNLLPNSRVRVSVQDNGMGLSLDQQAQLFQAFNRLGQESSGVEGTGIGLMVAKQLVELMGGTIGVQSKVGEGSVFWIELDTVDGPQLPAQRHDLDLNLTVVQRANRAHTLLYVEDNPANMQLMQEIMGRHSEFDLRIANNGLSGFDAARADLPDVILLDINLPGVNGYEVLKMLRDDALTAHIPVLALSANAMESDIKRGRKAGFLRYLTKPIQVDELLLALNAALEIAGAGKPPV
jgi:PAS domain S-box-containing protein